MRRSPPRSSRHSCWPVRHQPARKPSNARSGRPTERMIWIERPNKLATTRRLDESYTDSMITIPITDEACEDLKARNPGIDQDQTVPRPKRSAADLGRSDVPRPAAGGAPSGRKLQRRHHEAGGGVTASGDSTKGKPIADVVEPVRAWSKHDVAAQFRLEPAQPREPGVSHVRVGRHPRIVLLHVRTVFCEIPAEG
jgi:hypothetical protein